MVRALVANPVLLLSVMGLTLARAEVAPPASTSTSARREALQAAAESEFQASAQALRERLKRAEAGDALGAAVAEQALQDHRVRFLDLKRALARLSETSSSAAAERNPFEPDFHGPRVKPAVKEAAPAPGRGWDLYARIAQDPPSEEGVLPLPRSSTPGSHWGMYGSSAAPSETPARPFLVYRALKQDNAAGHATDLQSVLQSADIHTKE